MNARQVRGAARHDWFRCYGLSLGRVYSVEAFDSATGELVRFYDYATLRAWAGY